MSDNNDIFQNPDELGIEPYTVTGDLPLETKHTELVKVDELTEIDTAKNNLIQVTDIGSKALKQLYNLAVATDDPRVYRALSELIGSVTGANKEIVELYKVKAEMSRAAGPSQTNVTNNTLFVGSTADLNKFIDEMKRNNDPPTLEAYIDD